MTKKSLKHEVEKREVSRILRELVEEEVMRVVPHGMDAEMYAEVQRLQVDFGYKMAVKGWNECIEYHMKKNVPHFAP